MEMGSSAPRRLDDRHDPPEFLVTGGPVGRGRVDSPPTSTIAAPSATIRLAASTATAGSRWTPPSENESGVTLTTPITDGRGEPFLDRNHARN